MLTPDIAIARQRGQALVDRLYAREGIYLIASGEGTMFVEVADGECHQLEPHSGEFKRDGVLRRETWNPVAVLGVYGPFARVAPC